MEKRALILLVCMAILAIANVAKGGEFVVTGYNDGEFTLNNSREMQVLEEIEKIKKDARFQDQNFIPNILVEGLASLKGNHIDNEGLSEKRANVIVALISNKLPHAKINRLPKGDSENTKEVHVKWDFVQTAKPAKSGMDTAAIIITVLISTAVIAVVVLRRAKSNDKEVTKDQTQTKSVIAKVDGKTYSISARVDGRFYILPFMGDNGELVKRDSPEKVKKAFVWIMRNKGEGFTAQRNELLSRGVISVSN